MPEALSPACAIAGPVIVQSQISGPFAIGCDASFDTLEEAVAYCRTAIDKEIAGAIEKAEAGEITTPEQIKEARSELSTFGWNYFVSNAADPAASNAFEFLDYAEQRLTEILARRRAKA